MGAPFMLYYRLPWVIEVYVTSESRSFECILSPYFSWYFFPTAQVQNQQALVNSSQFNLFVIVVVPVNVAAAVGRPRSAPLCNRTLKKKAQE